MNRSSLTVALAALAFVGVVTLSDLDDAKCPIGTPSADSGEGGPDSTPDCHR